MENGYFRWRNPQGSSAACLMLLALVFAGVTPLGQISPAPGSRIVLRSAMATFLPSQEGVFEGGDSQMTV
jgi:hypothetical protein